MQVKQEVERGDVLFMMKKGNVSILNFDWFVKRGKGIVSLQFSQGKECPKGSGVFAVAGSSVGGSQADRLTGGRTGRQTDGRMDRQRHGRRKFQADSG